MPIGKIREALSQLQREVDYLAEQEKGGMGKDQGPRMGAVRDEPYKDQGPTNPASSVTGSVKEIGSQIKNLEGEGARKGLEDLNQESLVRDTEAPSVGTDRWYDDPKTPLPEARKAAVSSAMEETGMKSKKVVAKEGEGRIVDDGDWQYRVYDNGAVTILKAPAGSKAVGISYEPGTKIAKAIVASAGENDTASKPEDDKELDATLARLQS